MFYLSESFNQEILTSELHIQYQGVYECGVCGMKKDRDLNAAINLDCYGRDTLQPDLKCA